MKQWKDVASIRYARQCQAVADFERMLKRQVSRYNYADHAEVMMWNQFVQGIVERTVRRKLLSEPMLAFTSATEITVIAEQVNVDPMNILKIYCTSFCEHTYK